MHGKKRRKTKGLFGQGDRKWQGWKNGKIENGRMEKWSDRKYVSFLSYVFGWGWKSGVENSFVWLKRKMKI